MPDGRGSKQDLASSSLIPKGELMSVEFNSDDGLKYEHTASHIPGQVIHPPLDCVCVCLVSLEHGANRTPITASRVKLAPSQFERQCKQVAKRTSRRVTQTCLGPLSDTFGCPSLYMLCDCSLHKHNMRLHLSVNSGLDSDIVVGTIPVPEHILIGKKEQYPVLVDPNVIYPS